LVCLNSLYKSLVTMNHFYKSCVEIDLAWLHYVIIIEPLTVMPTESLSIDSEQFMNKLIEEKNQ
jgi:hypothetical protein